VRGERRDERSDEKDGRVLRELRYGAFRRSFSLPEHITADDVSASYSGGLRVGRLSSRHPPAPRAAEPHAVGS
jgi:hypothetical protein